MTTPTPTISVSLVTYNHERYVAESIRSVLNQTFTDFELVIVDDGSTDRTPEVIASFNDPRIVSIRQENGGPGAATNRALSACRGKYVAMMTGDDLSVPQRLQTQLDAYVRGEPRLLFSGCDFIDDAGKPFPDGHFAHGLFPLHIETRADIVRHFFDVGNFINAVTGFGETRLFREIGPYDPTLFQLQDFEMWIRFVKKYPLQFLPEQLLHYRIRSGGANLSTPSPAAFMRCDNELLIIMREFFTDMAPELFRAAFGNKLLRPDIESASAMKCEQAFLLLKSPRTVMQMIGVERLHALFTDPECAALLANEFQFPVQAFVQHLGTTDYFGAYRDHWTTLYLDLGPGFREQDRHVIPALHEPPFCLHFSLQDMPHVENLRWDPVERRHCRVQLRRAVWFDTDGNEHDLDLAAATGNGRRDADGTFVFDTIDPMIMFPVAARVRAVEFAGTWTIVDPRTSLLRTHELAYQHERSLQEALIHVNGLHHALACREQALEGMQALARVLDEQLNRTLDRRLRRWLTHHAPRTLQLARWLRRRVRRAPPAPAVQS